MGVLDAISRWLNEDTDERPEDMEDGLRDYSGQRNSAAYTLLIEKPKRYNEAERMADKLKCGDCLIISLTDLSKEDSQRLIDFLTGVVMARDGMIRKISSDIIVCTPENIKVVLDK